MHETNLLDTLKDLIALDYDALSAYKAAIDRLDDPICRSVLREFMMDHRRHTEDLSPVVTALGGVAPTEGDMKVLLTKGKVLVGQITGDHGILAAMRSNEDDTNKAYENAVRRSDVPADIRPILERALADERRHRAWIEGTLQRMNASTQEPIRTVPPRPVL